MPTYQDNDFVQERIPAGVINLNVGMPSPTLLPADLMNRLHLHIPEPSFLTYTNPQGYLAFRKILAGFLEKETGMAVDPESLMLTAGNSSVIELVASRVRQAAGERIAAIVETPTYYYGAQTIWHADLALVFVPVDADGLDVGFLEWLLESGVRPGMLYLVPNFQNPTGTNLSEARAARLLALAEEHGFLILADDPYQLLPFEKLPRPSFGGLDASQSEWVITAGSFSKIFAPAVRLGWLQAHPRRIAWLLEHPFFVSGGGLNPVMANLLSPLVEDGSLGENIRRIRRVLRQRKDRLVTALHAYLPGFTLRMDPEGGYFIYGEFTEGMDTEVLAEQVFQQSRVVIRPGVQCYGKPEGMRLSFAFHTEEELEEGVRRVGRMAKNLGIG